MSPDQPACDIWRRGESFFAAALASVADVGLDAPSLLAGWSRRRVAAHVAGNADALLNLVTWAGTGVETPMYPSPAAREAGITSAHALPTGALRREVNASGHRLGVAVAALPAQAWATPVRTAQGRTVPASEVLWMRAREVWVHAVDLRSGPSFADVPASVCTALVDDVFASWRRRGDRADVEVIAVDADRQWGTGAPSARGSLADVAAWVTGRSTGEGLVADGGELAELPRWL